LTGIAGGLLLLAIALPRGAGAQTFRPHVVTERVPLAQDVAAADVDGDGDTDLLTVSFEDNRLLWYERRADSSYTEHVIADGLDGAYTIHPVDLNGNGAVDVLVGALRENNVLRFQNDGSGNFGGGRVINDEAVVPYDVYAAPINGDDPPDVLVAAHDRGAVLWYQNNGDGTFGGRQALSTTVGGVRDVSAGDLTGNGRTDVVSAAADDGEVAWHENTETGFQKRVLRRDTDGAAGVHVADVVGKEAPDVLAAALGTNEVLLFENTGRDGFDEHLISDRAAGAQSVEAADLGEDGTVDVLAALRQDDRIVVYDQSEDERFSTGVRVAADGASRVAAADVDGDGDTDVLAASQGDGTIRWLETNLAPRARDTTFRVREDRELRVAGPGLLASARDPDGDSLRADRVTTPAAGSLASVDETGAFVYRADAFDELATDERRTLAFQYEAVDPSGLADTARAELTVVGVNDRPRARPDVDTTTTGTTVTTAILENDGDVDGRPDPGSVGVVSLPAHGSVAAADSGTIAYTPDPDFAGTDRYTYTVEDGAGGADTAAVAVRVLPPAPPGLRGRGGEGEVRLQWRAPSTDRLQAYRVYRSAPGDADPRSLVETLTDVSRKTYVVDGLENRRIHSFAVTAVADSGLEGTADTIRAVPRPPQVSLAGTVSFGAVDQTSGYRMIGLPGAPDEGRLSDVLSGTAGTDWTAFAAPGITETDGLVGYQADPSAFDLRRGRGFWVLSDEAWSPEGDVARAPLDERATATVPLPRGWSVVTNPFPEPVAWSRVRRATPNFNRPLWGFDGEFATQEALDPYEGYYVFNDPDAPIDSLRVPYPLAADSTSGRGVAGTKGEIPGEPAIRIRADRPAQEDAGARPAEVYVQVRTAASRARDAVDRFAPPPVGGPSGLRLVLRSEAVSAQYPFLRREARPPDGDSTATFNLQLSGPPGATARVAADGIGAGRGALLYDPQTGRTFDLRAETPVFQIPAGPGARKARRLTLWVGRAESLATRRRAEAPSTFRLGPPAPNPTRSGPRLRYAVPDDAAPADVRITIYDLLGRTVQQLVAGPRSAGHHSVKWNGRDEQGRPVASGVYFCRLVADGTTIDTRKITIVR
jgi:hypothetical protein